MLLRARDELGVDLNDAVFIGDSMTDVQAGLAAGVDSMLVLTGLGVEQFRDHLNEVDGPFRISRSLNHAAEHLLQRPHMSKDAQSKVDSAYFSLQDIAQYLDSFTSVHDRVDALSRVTLV